MSLRGEELKQRLSSPCSFKQRHSKTLAALLATTTLSGCVTDHILIPRGTDEATLAHVSYAAEDHPDTSDGRRGIYILEVDGKRLREPIYGGPLQEVYLVPGTHKVKVMYWHAGMETRGVVTFDALPAKEYHVHTKAQDYNVRIWLTAGQDKMEIPAKWEKAS
jgi:hypothetical protein